MKASEIRSKFLDFFASKGHQIVASSPVVPGDDPTLLFTNAGMNQFKDVFLGFDKRAYARATTAQKCIRAGGKHNDLENVGYTARHHTFFEMLGNFSFGDYFKQDAIAYAWELLTEVYKLPAERLWVTVYAEDDEAYDIWNKQIGVPAERIVRIGDNKGARYASDNFWMMGDTGPCGPCTEIFYDHGPEIAGGPPGSPTEDGDRYIEIWNNVFMQFNRDEAGVMHKLPKPSVDTGMGLERLTAVLQHVHSNYEIDTFVNLLAAAKKAVDAAGGGAIGNGSDKDSPSLKVIADHIRACSFTVVDGVIPSNAGRGYVLRRITRRAIRHGYKLGARKPFFHVLVAALVAEMGDAYPELRQGEKRVTEVLKQEEESFFRTIANGMEILEKELDLKALSLREYARRNRIVEVEIVTLWDDEFQWIVASGVCDSKPVHFHVAFGDSLQSVKNFLNAHMASGHMVMVVVPDLEAWPTAPQTLGWWFIPQSRVLDGGVAFKLHDTFGFPLDLTADVCRERGVTVDVAGFNRQMDRQREQARAAGKFKMAAGLDYSGADTKFHGYEHLTHEGCKVTAVYVDGTPVHSAKAGDDAVIVLDHTPFYAESGGQVGDTGELRNATSRMLIEDTVKIQAAVFGHEGRVVEGEIRVGDTLNAEVAFKLHDTFGFPLDLTADVCRERGVTVDEAGFNRAMDRQREQARAAGKFKMAAGLDYSGADTEFHGYEHLTHEGCKVTAVYVDGTSVASAKAGDDAVIVLDHTPF
ncbi:alanine--tRNA ligase, partial [Methylibium sp.]|uniref:alanine--tRNA ligase n=1 Tax=Methylibium sp. TaxID=2067992 RepID=UPI00286AF385